jgi:hypothetical protein
MKWKEKMKVMFINFFKSKLFLVTLLLTLLCPSLYSADITNIKNMPIIWNVQRNTIEFYGREDVLKHINQYYKTSKEDVKHLTLIGLPGIGKTEIAKRYASNVYQDYDIVWWFYPSENLESQFLNLAKTINEKKLSKEPLLIASGNPSESIEQIKDFLRTSPLNWLLIFDDVQNINQINQYIPEHHSSSKAHLLITSKNAKDWRNYFQVNRFPRETSIGLLQKTTGDNDLLAATKLASLLDDYPILISRAAMTIKDYSLNITQFSETVKTSGIHFDIVDLASKTLQFTLDNIQKKSESAYKLLMFTSILSNENIPKELLEKWFVDNNLGTQSEFNSALNILTKSFLLSKSSIVIDRSDEVNYDLYNMHDIIKKVVASKIKSKDMKVKIQEAILALNNLVSKKTKRVILPEFTYLFPQILNLSNLCHEYHIKDNQLLFLQMEVLDYYQIAERNFSKMENYAKTLYPNFNDSKQCHTEICARFNTSLSALKWWQGYHQEGLKYQLKASDYYAKNLPENAEYIRGLVYLTSQYTFLGELDDAEKTIKRVERILKAKTPDDTIFYNFNGAIFHQNISYILAYKGELAPAMQELDTSFQYLSKINSHFKDPKKHLAMHLHFLIQKQEFLYLADQGKDQLDSLFKLYTDSIEALHTKQHRLTGIILFLLGNSLNLNGRTTEAEQYTKDSIHILDNWIGAGNYHKLQAQAHVILGDIYLNTNKNLEGLHEYLQAENIYKKSFTSLKVDELGTLYEKIIKLSFKLKDDQLARRYATLHRKTFSDNNLRSNKIISYFASS